MADRTGVNFANYVYTWDASDFTTIPTGGGTSFSLNGTAEPGQIFIDASQGDPTLNVDTSIANADRSQQFVIADPQFDSEGNYIPDGSGSATTLVLEDITDFTAPDGSTYWLAHITGTDSAGNAVDSYISNYPLEAGDTLTSIGVDTNPYDEGTSGAGYNSFRDVDGGNQDFKKIWLTEADSPVSPAGSPSGNWTMQAWNVEDVVFANGIVSIREGAESGKFITYDNDDYIADGGSNYADPLNDLSQIGNFYDSDGNLVAGDLVYQAENGYFLQDQNGETFQIVKITFGDDIDYTAAIFFTERPLNAGDQYTFVSGDGSPGQFNSGYNETSFQYTNLAPCYTTGTAIETELGEVAIEDIQIGDRVKTFGGEYKAVRWIGKRRAYKAELEANSKLYPVMIKAGALGEGLPKRDLVVSRQHRMMIRSELTKKLVGSSEALIPAIKLTALPGIYVDETVDSVEYIHLLLDDHDAIFAEGTAAETLYLGEMALSAFDDAALEELLAIFPDLWRVDFYQQTHFAMPNAHKAKEILALHASKSQPLFQV